MNKINARDLTIKLMKEHGLLEKGWQFKFDRATRRLGQCNYSTKTISLSRSYAELNKEIIVKNTILHEIAHALAGPLTGHGYKWKTTALSIGCDGERVCRKNIIRPKMKYTAVCPNCGKQSEYRKQYYAACGSCCRKYNKGKYTELYKLIFKTNE